MADPPGEAFFYHRAVAPMLWVFIGLAAVELVVDHLLLAHWSRSAAIVVGMLSLGSAAWFVGVVRSFRRLPVLVTCDSLVMRAGTLKTVTVPLADVLGLRSQWDAAALKQRGMVSFSLLAYPNVVVDLAPSARRRATALAHRLDDPVAFATVLARAIDRKGAVAAASFLAAGRP